VEALEVARGKKLSLIITDVNMPRMDGITLVQRLRALPEFKFTPILVLTTESDASMKLRGKEAGATGWIVKPFSPEKLLDVVNKVL
jgi:two-component system chemotaxis response regulator CheY